MLDDLPSAIRATRLATAMDMPRSPASEVAPGVEIRQFQRPGYSTPDRCVIVWVDRATESWCACADVLVLPDEPTLVAARKSTEKNLRRFPSCMATISPVDGHRFLVHNRTCDTVIIEAAGIFPADWAELTYRWTCAAYSVADDAHGDIS
jgi:hypothetical protein